jgi:acyl-CoA-binding protein
MTLEQQFNLAKEQILTLTEKPSNETMLSLYGLYKQGSHGDINLEPPGVFDFVAKAKYNAWERLKGLSKAEAMQQYINLVNALIASAPRNENRDY